MSASDTRATDACGLAVASRCVSSECGGKGREGKGSEGKGRERAGAQIQRCGQAAVTLYGMVLCGPLLASRFGRTAVGMRAADLADAPRGGGRSGRSNRIG